MKDFLEGIIKEIARVRKDLGLKDGLTNIPNNSELSNERKDRIV